MNDILRDPRINNYNHFSKAGISSSFSGPLTGDITGTQPPEEAKEGWWRRAGCSRDLSFQETPPRSWVEQSPAPPIGQLLPLDVCFPLMPLL